MEIMMAGLCPHLQICFARIFFDIFHVRFYVMSGSRFQFLRVFFSRNLVPSYRSNRDVEDNIFSIFYLDQKSHTLGGYLC